MTPWLTKSALLAMCLVLVPSLDKLDIYIFVSSTHMVNFIFT